MIGVEGAWRQIFYVTFGTDCPDKCVHDMKKLHSGNGYYAVEAEDEPRARQAVIDVFGKNWAFIYLSPPEAVHAPAGCIGRIIKIDDSTTRLIVDFSSVK